MDPQVLLDIAAEELSCVPEGHAYTVDQFVVRFRPHISEIPWTVYLAAAHSSIETKNGAKALFTAFESGSPTGSQSGRSNTVRRNVALVERECLTHSQQQDILEELGFMWMLRHHPHVIDYSNSFLTPNFLAITSECANMGTLRSFLKRVSRANMRSQSQQQCASATIGVPTAPARFLFQQLVMVVDYCHRINESISGGLTPDNLVICWNGSAPQVKISATGQSGALSAVECPTLPSFAFKAPERILSGTPTLADDIFSLGTLLLYALTGSLPFPVGAGESEMEEMWASRIAQAELDIPQNVSNTEGLHGLLHGMLAPAHLRWTLSDIKQHPFFTTNLPEDALKLSDRVAAADQGSDIKTQQVFNNLRSLLSCCGAQPQHDMPTACHAAYPENLPTSTPHAQHHCGVSSTEPIHFGLNFGGVPNSSPVATASGYTTVASKQLSMQLGADFEGHCNLDEGQEDLLKQEMETYDGNVSCGAMGGAIGESLEWQFRQPKLQQQRSHELENVYSDKHACEEIRANVIEV